ncbi:Centlein [Eurypyga helias]|uniref:Centlein n=1 Tax=Eurypyga helias TaxID=54383 RepID=A0A093JFP9_EURHL|nr:Centlein [Eurypyga helias]
MKRHLIEDLKSRLKANQENEKTSNETLESLEKKVKTLSEDCSNKKVYIDILKQKLNVAAKEKSEYEEMYHKAKDELKKKDLKFTDLESKMVETESAMTELETSTSQQLHCLAKHTEQALETLQKKLLLTSDKVEEFVTFVKVLTRELQRSVQELRIKIRQAKNKGEGRLCKKGLSHESFRLAASILKVSTADLEEVLGDDEETAKTRMEFEKDKEWLQRIQKLLEAQFPFASYLTDAIMEKLNEKKKLVEEYSSLMKHTI